MKIESKKHWYSYTMNVLLIVLLAIPCLIFYFKSKEIPEINAYFRYGVLIFGLWLLYRTLRGIILNTRIRWIFENNTLTVKSGLLPWRRTDLHIPVSQIYEAYYAKSFMGSILNFGDLHIRRTDGVTSKLFQFTMTNPKKITSTINKVVQSQKQDDTSQRSSKESISDELRKLADLNKDGVISDEEFEKLKKKLIG